MESSRPRRLVFLCLLAALAVGIVIAGCGGSGGTTTTSESTQAEEAEPEPSEAPEAEEAPESESAAIETAPAFTAAELEEPGSEWVTNGGSTTNDRFSPLEEINTENVKELKGDWLTHLGPNATAAKFSAEGQPLEYKGVLYVSDGADDVYAISVKTGKKLWTYEPSLPPDPLGDEICCGWDNRGVALGEGMVFISQLNGKEVALDQTTGKVDWSSDVVPSSNGYSITSAPLYYNGRVYVGGSGGEYGVRGRLTAFDAKTGKLDWRFYTVPGPGETGNETWPKGEAYKHGGAAIWNTPTVDPKLNMLYFSTSNASPGYFGAVRKGDNLFTSSMVALDAETGKYKWHYQQVHHDLWDFDAPSPTVLVDAKMEGKMQHAVAEPSKTGWLYVLNRETGKPIFPIPEKAVAQSPDQDTAKKQPFPTLPGFSPHTVSKKTMKTLEEGLSGGVKQPKLIAKPMFYPQSQNPNVLTITPNDNIGGDNWPPSSFDQANSMYYVCSQTGATGFLVSKQKPGYKAGEEYGGNVAGVAAVTGFNSPGILTAYNLEEGKIAWQKHFPESCYSGTVTTAGGLVFVGQNDGHLQAFDAENGELLWSFQTGAGANTTATVFEDEGEEKIAFYSGGNSLAATPHGDDVWLFSLKGTVEEMKGTEAEAEGTEHKGEGGPEEEEEKEKEAEEGEGESGESAAAGPGNAMAGEEVFAENCSTCHGATGHGGNGGPDLRTMPLAKTEAGAIKQVTDGGGGMPAFKGQLSEEEIKNVAAYVVEDIVGGK
jgi:quinohemoprotein ethanol dehydrogenase